MLGSTSGEGGKFLMMGVVAVVVDFLIDFCVVKSEMAMMFRETFVIF